MANNRTVKEVVDKKIIVDIMEFAYEHACKGATVVIISNDTDYGYMLGLLQNKGVYVVLVYSKKDGELLNIGNKQFCLDTFYRRSSLDDETKDDADESLPQPSEPQTQPDKSEMQAGEEDSISESGSMLCEGGLLALLNTINTAPKLFSNGWARYAMVGDFLTKDANYNKHMLKERKEEALRQGYIIYDYIGTDGNPIPDRTPLNCGAYYVMLTEEGKEYLKDSHSHTPGPTPAPQS